MAALYPKSISGRKLLDQNGNVILAPIMSSWMMAEGLSNTEITTELTKLAAVGFKGVVVWIGGGWAGWTNKAGQNFWVGNNWQLNAPTDPLGAAWATVDWIVSECDRLGMVAHLSIAGGVAGSAWIAATATQVQNCGVAIATRYLSSPNIVWHDMEDSANLPSGTVGQRLMSIFTGINSVETGGSARPVRWMEPNNGESTFHQGWYQVGAFNCSTNSLYHWTTSAADIFESAWIETTGPTLDCEPVYVGNISGGYGVGGAWTAFSRQQIRNRNWATFLEGGCLINFGHEDYWSFGYGANYTVGLTWDQVVSNSPEVAEAAYCWSFIDTYCKNTSWAPGQFVEVASESSGGSRASAGVSNTAAAAYFPNNRAITVDTTIIPGSVPVRLRWLNPQDGSYSLITTSEAKQTGRAVTLPAARGDGSQDWVLVADNIGLTTMSRGATRSALTLR
jgi:hypothetical protein